MKGWISLLLFFDKQSVEPCSLSTPIPQEPRASHIYTGRGLDLFESVEVIG